MFLSGRVGFQADFKPKKTPKGWNYSPDVWILFKFGKKILPRFEALFSGETKNAFRPGVVLFGHPRTALVSRNVFETSSLQRI